MSNATAAAESAVSASSNRAQFHSLTVAEIVPLCADAVAVTLSVPESVAALYEFRAGQSVTVRRFVAGVEHRRSYSICAAVGEPLRIAVREVADGQVSSWLVRQLRPGDRIEVLPPAGSFTPQVTQTGFHALVVAGSGITPGLSIAGSLLAQSDSIVTMVYGNRRTDTVMFIDELADLKDRYPARFDLVHVLSREPRDAELLTGRLDPDRLRRLLPLVTAVDQIDHWWLCGPYPMVTGARAVLTEFGVAAERIHQELFYVDDVAPVLNEHRDPEPSGQTSDVTLVLDGRKSTVTLSREETVLDGAQRFRPDLPFACKGGVCGTCRARVTDGEVFMRRNFALEDSEVRAGFVLTCQSRPVTASVTVDFDA